MIRNAVAWCMLCCAAASAEEAKLVSPPLPPPEPPARNAIWIQPVAGGLGRASISYERALGKGATLHADLIGGLDMAAITDLAANDKITLRGGAGLVGLGVRAFPLGEAPFGPWLGATVRAGAGGVSLDTRDASDSSLFAHKEFAFLGEGELQAGYTLLVFKGLSVQGSLGLGLHYQRYLDGLAGEALSLGLTTWLGVGYAF